MSRLGLADPVSFSLSSFLGRSGSDHNDGDVQFCPSASLLRSAQVSLAASGQRSFEEQAAARTVPLVRNARIADTLCRSPEN